MYTIRVQGMVAKTLSNYPSKNVLVAYLWFQYMPEWHIEMMRDEIYNSPILNSSVYM